METCDTRPPQSSPFLLYVCGSEKLLRLTEFKISLLWHLIIKMVENMGDGRREAISGCEIIFLTTRRLVGLTFYFSQQHVTQDSG